MADYCTESDITANMKGVTISATSAVTTTALADIITQESAVIDAHIEERYDLPITDSTSLAFLKKICIDLVVWRVAKILQPANLEPVADNAATQDISERTAYRDAMRMLKDIMNGKAKIPNTDKATKSQFRSTAVDCADEYVFKHDEKQW